MFWHPWSTAAFQRAHASGRPVLLSLVTGWSASCVAMEANVFARPAVAAAIEAYAVPVRVDADVRPDIAERYGLGGWPTTVWLTPDGEMLTGGTYIDAETLIATVIDVAERWARDRAAIVRQGGDARAERQRTRVAMTTTAQTAEPMTLEAIRECIVREFDADYGGFGHGEKFPLAAPVMFALRAGVHARDAELVAIAEFTLDRMAASELIDGDTGAFRRACAERDWTKPDRAC